MRLIFSQLIYMYIIICVSAHFTLDLARHDLCPLIHSAILTLKYTLHACAIYYCYHDGKTCLYPRCSTAGNNSFITSNNLSTRGGGDGFKDKTGMQKRRKEGGHVGGLQKKSRWFSIGITVLNLRQFLCFVFSDKIILRFEFTRMTMALVKRTRVLRSIKRLIFFVNDFKKEDERGKNRSYRVDAMCIS